jgi:hypothetical protein
MEKTSADHVLTIYLKRPRSAEARPEELPLVQRGSSDSKLPALENSGCDAPTSSKFTLPACKEGPKAARTEDMKGKEGFRVLDASGGS